MPPRVAATVAVAGVALSHPDRVLWPEPGVTKRELAAYVEGVAPLMLPHLAGRPLTLLRCPSGPGGKCFIQRHAGPGAPRALRRVRVPALGGSVDYATVDDVSGLVALVQWGVIEIHPLGSPADDPDRPDRIVFDLDPGPGIGWDRIAEAARQVRDRLAGLGLRSWVKTTGGRGLHVVAPIARGPGWDRVKSFSRTVAGGLETEHPDRYAATVAKDERAGRIFIDILRNDRGNSAVAPWSPRARPGAPVSTPLDWQSLEPGRSLPGQSPLGRSPLGQSLPGLTVRSAPARIAEPGWVNSWTDLPECKQALPFVAPFDP